MYIQFIFTKKGCILEFEWDDEKNKKNQSKHGINFEAAALIFRGVIFTRIDNREGYNEIRKISTGELDNQIIIAVVHTDRGGSTRIISARLANRKERNKYYDYCKKITE